MRRYTTCRPRMRTRLGAKLLALTAGIIFAYVWLLAAPLADLLLTGLPPHTPTTGDVLEALFGASVWSALMYFLFWRRWLG